MGRARAFRSRRCPIPAQMDSSVPVGEGTSWPQLLRHLWLTAAASVCFLLLALGASLLASRFAVLRRRPGHPFFFAATEPRRCLSSRGEAAVEVLHLLMCLGSFIFYVVLTYQEEPKHANAGILTVTGIFLLYFGSYGLWRFLASFLRGELLAHACTVEAHLDLAATCALWLPFVVGSYFSFACLRLAALSLRQQREGAYSARFSWSKLHSFLFSAVLNFFCFVACMASVVTSLERAGNPSGWGAATQGEWAFAGAIYWAIITVTTIGSQILL